MPQRVAAYGTLDQLGIDELIERISDGEAVQTIADDLGITRQMIYQWVRKRGHQDAFANARKESASALVDAAHAALAVTSPETITIDREIVRLNTWTASRLNREQWGESPKMSVGFDLGSTFVEMLRGFGALADTRGSVPLAQDAPRSVGSTQQSLLVPRNIGRQDDQAAPRAHVGSTQRDASD